MGNVFDVYISTRGGPSTKLTLPAAPYEILDVLERVMPNQPDHSAMLGSVHIRASTIRAKYTKAKNMTSSLS